MKYCIRHESERSVRIHLALTRMTMEQADLLEFWLKAKSSVRKVQVYDRNCDIVISLYRKEDRKAVLESLDGFTFEKARESGIEADGSSRALNRKYQNKLFWLVAGRVFRKFFLPMPLNIAWTVGKSTRFIAKGLKSLLHGKLEVSVLDAAAITASMLTGDFDTAGSVMFLLDIGDVMEDWTYQKSVGDLARSMSLKVDKVWLVSASGEDVLVDVRDVKAGEKIRVATSGIIPLDGNVVSGEATVNQAAMTGESTPVPKKEGGYVYAGTVVEEGEIVVEVTKAAGQGKYDQIVKMIEETEKLKSDTETKAFRLADRLVPYSLAGTLITYLLTRNVTRAMAFLMVDFSCALNLSMPIAMLSALREAGDRGITVKGGKFLEAVADAETIVFDKTGTLTHATPTVVGIDIYNSYSEDDVLRIAACLEEHYPHSIANAVVNAAKKKGIRHDEMHSEVKYVVAHGIASTINGKQALIGSSHFVFEDEGCVIPEGQQEKFDQMKDEYTHLFLAIDGKLVATIHIFDPLREEAAEVIDELHKLGLKKVCMLTGDNRKTAAAIAKKLNIDEFRAEVLPEDKAAFIRKEHAAGRKVIMIGDGVNDSPGLSEADCGISVKEGAAIAREVSDITISHEGLRQLVYLRKLSMALMNRIRSNYRFILLFNGSLIALGATGIMQPSTTAMIHNTSTVVTGLTSMTDLLPEEDARKEA